jgi:hypothetical protein
MQTSIAGYDCGNNAIKLTLDGRSISVPSYLKQAQPKAKPSKGGYFEYVAGERMPPAGYLVGLEAWQAAPDVITGVASTAAGKTDLTLSMLLGALSYAAPESQTLKIVATIHHDDLAGKVTAALNGVHKVRFNDSGLICTVDIQVLRVLSEGAGAVATLGLQGHTSIVYDLGAGTTITTLIGPDGRRLQEPRVTHRGVSALISAIAEDSEFIQRFNKPGNYQRVRAGIEAGTFDYAQTGFNFRPLYVKHLQTWADETLKVAMKDGAPWEQDATRKVAIGGGAAMPYMAQALKAKGVEVGQRPAFANAEGLYRIAQSLAA